MQTYGADFFMTAFFTLIVRHVLVAIPVAGGGVIPAGGMVPAMATVTTPVAEADGADPTSSRSDSEGEAEGLQTGELSQCATIPIFGDSTRQQTHTWRTQLLVLSACAQPDDPAGP
jgi:hypothetical protein